MKIIRKNDQLLNNKGETIVEVVVAFAVLSIMMVMFYQGITYASRMGAIAENKRSDYDQALIKRQEKWSTHTDSGSPISKDKLVVHKHVYSEVIDGVTYTYVIYS
jgi:Tfp pilus assembly protein PilE